MFEPSDFNVHRDYFVENLKSITDLQDCIKSSLEILGLRIGPFQIQIFDSLGSIVFAFSNSPLLYKDRNSFLQYDINTHPLSHAMLKVGNQIIFRDTILSLFSGNFFKGFSQNKNQKLTHCFSCEFVLHVDQLVNLDESEKKLFVEIKKRSDFRLENKRIRRIFTEETIPVLLASNLKFLSAQMTIEEIEEKILALKEEKNKKKSELNEIRERIINEGRFSHMLTNDLEKGDEHHILKVFKKIDDSGIKVLREDKTPEFFEKDFKNEEND